MGLSSKWLTLLYIELGYRTVLVHGLHPTFMHGSKKLHTHCNSHTLVKGIDLLAKLCEGSWKGFLTQLVEENNS